MTEHDKAQRNRAIAFWALNLHPSSPTQVAATHFNHTVLAAADHPVAVGAEFETIDGAGLPLVCLDAPLAPDVPDLYVVGREGEPRVSSGWYRARPMLKAATVLVGGEPLLRTFRFVSRDPEATNSPKG